MGLYRLGALPHGHPAPALARGAQIDKVKPISGHAMARTGSSGACDGIVDALCALEPVVGPP